MDTSSASPKRTIFLHGYLGDLHPEPLVFYADTVAEALRGLEQIPALRRDDGSPHSVRIPGIESEIALFARSSMAEIHVYPVVGGGGGRGGLMQVLIGVLLVGVSIAFPTISLGVLGSISTSGMLLTGSLMALGGILQMLMPAPEASEPDRASKYLGSSGSNTVRIGTRIALIYGTRRFGGHYLSYDIDAVEVAPSDGESIVSEDSRYTVHDATPLPLGIGFAPVNPVYASSTPTVGGVPVSSWSPAG